RLGGAASAVRGAAVGDHPALGLEAAQHLAERGRGEAGGRGELGDPLAAAPAQRLDHGVLVPVPDRARVGARGLPSHLPPPSSPLFHRSRARPTLGPTYFETVPNIS